MTRWLSYGARTYQSIRAACIQRIQTLIPELTDLSENNVLIRMTTLWAAIGEQLHYYLDRTARESYVATAMSYRSLLHLAKLKGVSIPLSNPAKALLTFTTDVPAPVGGQTIPADTICTAPGTSLIFRTVASVVIPQGERSAAIQALQYVAVSNFVGQDIEGNNKPNATGEAGEAFYLPANIVQGSISMIVNGDAWTYKTTAAKSAITISEATDFYVSLDKSFRTIVYVGDGFIGATLPENAVVTFNYQVTQTESGNIAADSITVIQSSVPLASGVGGITVTNSNAAYGGRSIMSVETLRRYLTHYHLSDDSAVLLSDIRTYALRYDDVVDAAVSFRPNVTVVVSLLTAGNTDVPVQQLQDDFDDTTSSVLTMGLTSIVRKAQTITIRLLLKLNYEAGAVQNDVKDAVQAALENYFTVGSRLIGFPVFASDLFEVIEGVDGVANSEILEMVGLAEFIKVYDASISNNSAIIASIVDSSNQLAVWKLTHIQRGTTSDIYQIFLNDTYQGQLIVPINGSANTTIGTANISISYTALSAVGSSWEYFVSYYDGNKLVIPSGSYPQLGTLTFV